MCRRASNEGKLQPKTGTLEPSLTLISMILLKHTTSMRSMSNLPFDSTWKPFFRKPAPMTFEQRRMHYPGFSRWKPVSLQHIHSTRNSWGIHSRFTLCTPSWIPPLPWGKWVCKTQHNLSVQLTCIRKHIFKPAFTVAKFHFFHNQF